MVPPRHFSDEFREISVADTKKIFDGKVRNFTSGNDTKEGQVFAETYFIDSTGASGDDTIVGFGKNDILVVKKKLFDSNDDGIIAFGSALDLDRTEFSAGDDTVTFVNGPTALRYLGDADGNSVYADASVRLAGFTEGTVNDDAFAGDTCSVDTFFFDTKLDIVWGTDTISDFGAEDFLITTSTLQDSNGDGLIEFAANGLLDLSGAKGKAGGFGTVGITDENGDAVTALVYDGSFVQNGVTYYRYQLEDDIIPA
jgi:hypothetical protein